MDDTTLATPTVPGAAAQTTSDRQEPETTQSPEPIVTTIVTKDGVRLFPQPTNDPLDPLSWDPGRRNRVFCIVWWM